MVRRKALIGGQIMLIIYIVVFILCIALAYILLENVASPIIGAIQSNWWWLGKIVGVGKWVAGLLPK